MPRAPAKRAVSFKKKSAVSSMKKSNTAGTGKYKTSSRSGNHSRRDRGSHPFENLGTGIGKMLGSWTGVGDYVEELASASAPRSGVVLAPDPPRFKNDKDGTTIIHREYLGDILTSSVAGAFNVNQYGLNPSDSNTFPWLSQLCQPNFQQYKFEQLIFEFRTFSSDALNSTNTALGSVFGCINYDYSDPSVSSRTEVENTDWSNSCKPSQSMLIPVECDPKQTGLNSGLLYIINGNNVPAGADPKTYYLGKLFIGTTGLQAASVNIGSLYVSYRVKLYKPFMTKPLSNGLITMLARTGASAGFLWGNANTNFFGNCDSIGVSFAGNVMTINRTRLQVGQIFRLFFSVTGTAVAGGTPATLALSANATGVTYFSTIPGGNGFDTTVVSFPPSPASTTQVAFEVFFIILNNNSDVTATLSLGVYPTGAQMSNLQITQVCGIPSQQIGFYLPN